MNIMATKAQAQQPSNFEGLVSQSEGVDDVVLTRVFQCGCGQKGLKLVAGNWEGEDLWLDPVSYICPSCGKSAEFFNSQKHGYDGLLCDGAASMQSFEKVPVCCPKCASEEHVIRANISYNIDFDNPDELAELSDEMKKRLEDLYDALSLKAECTSCGEKFHIGDWELA